MDLKIYIPLFLFIGTFIATAFLTGGLQVFSGCLCLVFAVACLVNMADI